MKALLVTSQVTFVPHNYDWLVAAMAQCPHIGGLVILRNAGFWLLKTIAGAAWIGAGRIAAGLLRNLVRGSSERLNAYRGVGKPVWFLRSMNDAAALELAARERFDLIINARTRCIYRPEILQATPLGCINIHHGLLPEQRGVMCDLWALAEGHPAGFSIHRMTENVDAGPILRREVISDCPQKDYLAYLERTSRREAEVLAALLARLAQGDNLEETPHIAPPGSSMRRNPGRADVARMKARGMLV